MIEAIQKGHGVSRARAVCDECGTDEVVTCDYLKKGGKATNTPNVAQVRTKIAAHGWSHVKGRDYCIRCEQKRKVVPIKEKEAEVSETDPRQPTKPQKRQIIAMLDSVYDDEAGRYEGGETDNTVAETLGVMPGWVAELREDLFGPAGENEDMAKMAERLSEQADTLDQIIKDATAYLGKARAAQQSVIDMQKEMDAIRRAVGKHTLRKAAV